MQVSIPSYKLSISQPPTYLDGYFALYLIVTKEVASFPVEGLKLIETDFPFEYRSIGDKLRFEADQRKLDITHKVRIPQTREITALHVLKIGEEYMQVYNTFHFTNKDGYKQTDITLKRYDKEVKFYD